VATYQDGPADNHRIYRIDPNGHVALRAQLDQFWRRAMANYKQLVEESTEEDE
jgi:hypothetical protein